MLVVALPVAHLWHDGMCVAPAENRAAFEAAGAVEAIVAAMRLAPRLVTLQLKACWAVANLAADYGETERERASVVAEW